jgi:hypothetical protein
MSYDIDSGNPNNDRLFELVPVADVLVPGLSGQPAQHLSLARGGCRPRGGLARLVFDRRLSTATVRRLASRTAPPRWKRTSTSSNRCSAGLKSRGYVPGPLVIDPKCG